MPGAFFMLTGEKDHGPSGREVPATGCFQVIVPVADPDKEAVDGPVLPSGHGGRHAEDPAVVMGLQQPD